MGKSCATDPYLNGELDDLKLFKRALAQTEINNEMNIKRPLLN
jgi:hypothetical protein